VIPFGLGFLFEVGDWLVKEKGIAGVGNARLLVHRLGI